MKRKLFLVLAVMISLVGCAPMPQQTKSSLELQAIQSREFETSKKIAFAAVMSVFQDLGYTVGSASLDTGFITAQSPVKQDLVLFVGQRMRDVKATAFVEEIAPGRTRVRLNFVNVTQTSSGYGMKGDNEVPIEDPKTYQQAFTKIEHGIFIRKNVD
jgi:hypothetical protein